MNRQKRTKIHSFLNENSFDQIEKRKNNAETLVETKIFLYVNVLESSKNGWGQNHDLEIGPILI